jgi:hypothetical protein
VAAGNELQPLTMSAQEFRLTASLLQDAEDADEGALGMEQ